MLRIDVDIYAGRPCNLCTEGSKSLDENGSLDGPEIVDQKSMTDRPKGEKVVTQI